MTSRRYTLDLDEELLDRARRALDVGTDDEAVEEALRRIVQRAESSDYGDRSAAAE